MLYFKKILIFIKSLKTEYFKYTNLFNFKENFFIIFSNVINIVFLKNSL